MSIEIISVEWRRKRIQVDKPIILNLFPVMRPQAKQFFQTPNLISNRLARKMKTNEDCVSFNKKILVRLVV